jgi:C4-dicarboxylate transporter DctM subunit
MLWNTLQQTVELGWDFYVPVLMFVALIALAVPVWAAIGSSAILMLVMSGDLPLSLVGERLFTGIDAFALTAIPLFILTGDVLVRTGLSRKFLDVAEALTCFTRVVLVPPRFSFAVCLLQSLGPTRRALLRLVV